MQEKIKEFERHFKENDYLKLVNHWNTIPFCGLEKLVFDFVDGCNHEAVVINCGRLKHKLLINYTYGIGDSQLVTHLDEIFKIIFLDNKIKRAYIVGENIYLQPGHIDEDMYDIFKYEYHQIGEFSQINIRMGTN